MVYILQYIRLKSPSFIAAQVPRVDLNFKVAFCLEHSLSQNCYEQLSPRVDLCCYAFAIS